MKITCFLLVIFFPVLLFAQEKNGLLMDIHFGGGAGWWVYNKGTTNGQTEGNLGWDHTPTKGIINAGVDFLYQRNKWKIGPGFDVSFFYEDFMLASDHSQGHNHKYRISEKSVKLLKFYLQTEYDLFHGKRFVLSPQVKLGSFLINTTHPQKNNFGFKLNFEAGLNTQVVMNDFLSFLFKPSYNFLAIWPKEKIAQQEKHNLYFILFNTGMRLKLVDR